MRELNEQTKEVDPALLAISEIKEAIHLAEEAGYTPAELNEYEAYWKQVSSEKTLQIEATEKGRAEGMKQGIEQGREEGREEGRVAALNEAAKKMKDEGMTPSLIAKLTGISVEQIEKL